MASSLPVMRWLDRAVGGRERRRVIVVLASVLALDSADKATVGTSATQLQQALGIGTAQIGLLLAVGSLVGAVATVPAGVLVDRANRTRTLSLAILTWGVAMALSAAATDYLFLLLTRLALGAVTAVSGPAVASLIGDFFPQRERGRSYGFVLAGELVGTGFGFAVAGQFASLSWRAPFLVLVAPTILVWWLVHRLPEPERGSRDALQGEGSHGAPQEEDLRREGIGLAGRMALRESVRARTEAVSDQPPDRMSLWQAVRHVLQVRTNVVLVVSSALGYFFFSGLRGFAVEFAKRHYDISQSVATTLTLVVGLGALGGVLSGGRVADHLLRRGRVPARVEVAGGSVLAAACVFVPAILTRAVGVAVPLLLLASLFLGAANPPLDAARLDILHPRLWGRAEAIRTVLRNGGDAMAPLLFGVLAASVFSGGSALEYTFLTMLSALFAAALITLLVGRRTYPSDVAAAAEFVTRFPPSAAGRES